MSLIGLGGTITKTDLRPADGVYEAVGPSGQLLALSVEGFMGWTYTPRSPSASADGPGAQPRQS